MYGRRHRLDSRNHSHGKKAPHLKALGTEADFNELHDADWSADGLRWQLQMALVRNELQPTDVLSARDRDGDRHRATHGALSPHCTFH